MQAEIIFYVKDQQISKQFYSRILNATPTLDVPGMVEFTISEGLKLGLMPESGISKIICPMLPNPSSGNGIPRCELYLLTINHLLFFERALSAGAKLISHPLLRDWGHIVSYVADPDGHVLAFAGES